MVDELASLIREIASRKELDGYDEATTQQCVILPVFRKLGWNDSDPKEVTPQYSTGKGRCDYALSLSAERKVLCEVKTPSERDLAKHEQQLVNYAFERGAELAVLTNGVSWWFYLPMQKGPWERRKFFTVDIRNQTPEDAASRLEDFLSKANLKSGKAVATAEDLQRGREKKEIIDKAFPEAWREMMTGPDYGLVALLCDRVEKMCGFKPSEDQAKHFLAGFSERGEPKDEPSKPQDEKRVQRTMPRRGSARATGITKHKTYEPLIIAALKKFGGRASSRDVLEWIATEYGDKFSPGDMEMHSSGGRVWENRVHFRRLVMKQQGKIRSGSPRGIWELA